MEIIVVGQIFMSLCFADTDQSNPLSAGVQKGCHAGSLVTKYAPFYYYKSLKYSMSAFDAALHLS